METLPFDQDYGIMDKVKSFEDALEILETKSPGIKEEYRQLSQNQIRYKGRLIAEFKLMVITEALNDGWKADWKSFKQDRYYPIFRLTNSDPGIRFNVCSPRHESPPVFVGSRMCFSSINLAKYAGKTFVDLYAELYTG